MIDILCKTFSDTAKVPSQKHESDFGFDLVADTCVEIAPNVYQYECNVAFQTIPSDKFPQDEWSYSIDIRCRSSVWETGMILANAIGTVDIDYRGRVKCIFYHVLPNMPKYNVGDKIAQCMLVIAPKIKFTEVDELDMNTSRGTNGFGSTGR